MSALAIDPQEYAQLVARALPHVIHTEEENERYISELEALTDREDLSPSEQELMELLTLLIEDFEKKHYQLKPATPVEILEHLMEANDLKQVDLLDVFGSPSIVSEILKGKRELSKTHIQKLSQRFHVSPELFFPPTLAT
jgi:HTH-type transcriptional regulator/antitoxin HigA